MKIAFLSTGMGIGGAEQQVLYLCDGLRRRGHRVLIVSLRPLGTLGYEGCGMGIETISLGMDKGIPDPRGLARLIKILRRWRPDVLSCFMFHANIMGRAARGIAGVPVAVSSIRNEFFGGRGRDCALRFTDWMGDMTTTNSRLAAETLVRRGVAPRERLRVIPNAIDMERFNQSEEVRKLTREELGVGGDSFLWLAAGRLKEQKDYFTLIRAFHRLAGKNVCLAIAGPGPLEGALKAFVYDLGLQNNVFFLGFRRDIPELLAAADALALSSAWEGLPNIVMESMAAGRPVAATAVGGVPELVFEGKNGFLSPPGDPGNLARSMLRIMELSAAERSQMGRFGRSFIKENYGLQRVAILWEHLYADLLYKRKCRYA